MFSDNFSVKAIICNCLAPGYLGVFVLFLTCLVTVLTILEGDQQIPSGNDNQKGKGYGGVVVLSIVR